MVGLVILDASEFGLSDAHVGVVLFISYRSAQLKSPQETPKNILTR